MSDYPEPNALCILVFDDDQDTVDSFSALLEQLGHTVHTASGGIRAVELIESLHPDLVFLDLLLPDFDGFEIAKRIRREPRLSETKIVAVTAHNDPKHRLRALYAGFDGYLVKPASLQDITAAIDDVNDSLQASGESPHPFCRDVS
jgi:two-component system OmpR family response regulator